MTMRERIALEIPVGYFARLLMKIENSTEKAVRLPKKTLPRKKHSAKSHIS